MRRGARLLGSIRLDDPSGSGGYYVPPWEVFPPVNEEAGYEPLYATLFKDGKNLGTWLWGIKHPGKLNCLGYACGKDYYLAPYGDARFELIPGEVWQLGSLAFLLEFAFGWDCEKVQNASECECPQKGYEVILVYVYVPESEARKKLLRKYQRMDVWHMPWRPGRPDATEPGELDYHALRCEEDGRWWMVPEADVLRKARTIPSTPADVEEQIGEFELEKRCCRRCKPSEEPEQ